MILIPNQQSSMESINNLANQVGKSSLPYSEGMKPLKLNFQPGPMDVICARGNAVKNHPGNKYFVSVVQEHLQEYANATSKFKKSLIVSAIIEAIRNGSPEGGFVKQKDGRWYEAGDAAAREKVGQRLRDLLHCKYSSSSRAKKRRRRAEEESLVSRIDDIVAQSNGTQLADRVQELSAPQDSSNKKGKKKSDFQMQLIFNQANCELLASIKQGESCCTSRPKRKLEFDHDCGDSEETSSSSSYEDLFFSNPLHLVSV